MFGLLTTSSTGLSLKLDNAGIKVLDAGMGVIPRSVFVLGNAYLCVRQDDQLELRDASGLPFTISIKCELLREGDVALTKEMASMISKMEVKCGCPTSMVIEEDEVHWLTCSLPPECANTVVSLQAKLTTANGMKKLQWSV